MTIDPMTAAAAYRASAAGEQGFKTNPDQGSNNPGSGSSFVDLVKGAALDAIETNRKAEEITTRGLAGQANITTLIDAQNNALGTELSALNAIYTFILDFLVLERSIGYFNFLASPAERDAFFQQAQQYFNQ